MHGVRPEICAKNQFDKPSEGAQYHQDTLVHRMRQKVCSSNFEFENPPKKMCENLTHLCVFIPALLANRNCCAIAPSTPTFAHSSVKFAKNSIKQNET